MPVDYFTPTELSRYDRPWYSRTWIILPLLLTLVLLLAGLIAFFPLAAALKQQAAALDLSHLEQMESASVILDRNNKIFGQIYVENRETIPYDQLPRNLVNAIIAMEDNKFYQHRGYDLLGIVRAALKNSAAGHVRQGASTITQQLARNSFDLKGKTFRRKLLEMFVARRIEDNFSKQKIMELYLNRIYFGGGLYGAEAAARGYFRQASARNVARGMRHARRPGQEPEQTFALDRSRGLEGSAQLCPQPDARARLHQRRAMRERAGRGFAIRQPAERARPELRDRLHPPAGDRRRRLGPGDERGIPDSHDDRLPSCKRSPKNRSAPISTRPKRRPVTTIKPTHNIPLS